MKTGKVYDKKFVRVQCAIFKKVEAARTKEDSKETDRQRRLKRSGNGFPHFAQRSNTSVIYSWLQRTLVKSRNSLDMSQFLTLVIFWSCDPKKIRDKGLAQCK